MLKVASELSRLHAEMCDALKTIRADSARLEAKSGGGRTLDTVLKEIEG